MIFLNSNFRMKFVIILFTLAVYVVGQDDGGVDCSGKIYYH